MEVTGERYFPSIEGENRYEHMHRYALAREYVAGKNVLDIACGEGYGCALLSETAASVAGVDIDPETVEHAIRTYPAPNLTFQSDPATPFRSWTGPLMWSPPLRQ
jgi:2-polyprenyl-3-methyl-5-hydroxy-6-metoxy-1,4-benzoquinol methylase